MKPCQTAHYPPFETASSMSTCLIENKTKKKCVYSNVPDNMYLTLAIKNQVSVNHDLSIKDSIGFKIRVPFCAGLQDLSTRSAVQPVRSLSRCRLNSLHETALPRRMWTAGTWQRGGKRRPWSSQQDNKPISDQHN